MKRTAVLLVCFVAAAQWALAQQFNGFNGEVRYQYQYTNNTTLGSTATTSTQSPMLRLATNGSILDPSIITFDLQTSLNLSTSNSQAAQYSLSNKSFAWDYYDVGIGLLQNFPVNTYIRLNDGMTQSFSHTQVYDQGGYIQRRQEQNVRLMSSKIPSLPSISFIIDRSHQWSLNSPIGSDQTSMNYSLNLSSGGKGGSVNVGGTLSESSERFTGATTKYYTLLVHGTRSLADLQTINYDVNYNRYVDITNINGLASYIDASDKQFHYTTTVSSHSNSAPTYQTLLSNVSENVQYIPNDHYRYTIGVNGSLGRNESISGDGDNANTSGGNASFSASHNDAIGTFGYSNGVGLGYGVSKFITSLKTFSSSFSNGISTPLGAYQVAVNHSLTYGQTRNDFRRDWVSNAANLNLSGPAFYDFQGQLVADYESDIYSGDLQGYGNHKGISLQWSLNSPLLYIEIPFTVGVSGGENWYYEGYVGRTSNWSASFTSTQFFVRNLTMVYRLTRVYDPNYNKQSINHSVSSQYQFRSLAFEVRYESYQLLNSRNDFWFTVSRPF